MGYAVTSQPGSPMSAAFDTGSARHAEGITIVLTNTGFPVFPDQTAVPWMHLPLSCRELGIARSVSGCGDSPSSSRALRGMPPPG